VAQAAVRLIVTNVGIGWCIIDGQRQVARGAEP